MRSETLSSFQKKIGYRFRNPALLVEALTHSSAKGEGRPSNERLEFFGDAVLGLVVSEELLKRFPKHQEGDLTQRKSTLVSRPALHRISQDLGMSRYLTTGGGVGPRAHPPSILANAVESVIAAVYLDGGLKAAKALVWRLHKNAWKDAAQSVENAKSVLQQFTQRKHGFAPMYVLLSEQGPEHQKTFRVAARVSGRELGRGTGPTKKEAEQQAAAAALRSLRHPS